MRPHWTASVLTAVALVTTGAVVFRPTDDFRNSRRAWALVEEFQSKQPGDVDGALWDLYRLGESAAPALISLIRDDCSATSGNSWTLLDALGARGIPYFVDALSDANPRVRSAAAIRLSLLGMLEKDSDEMFQAGRPAIPRLLALLDDDDTAVASYAGSALATLLGPGDEPLIPALLKALRRQADRYANRTDSGGFYFQYQPAFALAAIGPAALPALREAMRDPLEETRKAAMEGLRRMGPEAAPAVSELVEIIRNQIEAGPSREPERVDGAVLLGQIESSVAIPLLWEASRALGACGEGAASAVPVLTAWVDDRRVPRRRQAVDALGRIGPAALAAVPVLVQSLADDEIDVSASEALARIGDAAIPALLIAVSETSTRSAAIRALGLMGESASEAGEEIRRVFERSDGDIRCEAAAALWQIGHEAQRALVALADDCSNYREPLRNPGPGAVEAIPDLFRRFCETPSRTDYAFALAKLGDPAIPLLIDALKHDNARVRRQTTWILERTTGDLEPAIPALTDALRDPEEWVRHGAGHALRRAGPRAASAIPQIVEALAQEEDAYRWGVLLDTLLGMPDDAGAAVPVLQRVLNRGDVLVRIRADQALDVLDRESKPSNPESRVRRRIPPRSLRTKL